ncbi:unnamed protein product, partial [Owenia fusiformis]
AVPSITTHPPSDVDVINSDSTLPTSLKCIDKAKPGSSYKWYLNNSEITSNHAVYAFNDSPSISGKWTTTTSSLKWKDGSTEAERRGGSGNIKCTATNDAGSADKTANVNVQC